MDAQTMAERIERLQSYVDAGRITRGEWTGKDAQGRETVSLIPALSPEAYAAERVSACPESVMPQWLAHLTSRSEDCVSLDYWPEFVRGFAAAAARWHVLDESAWRRVLARVLLAVLGAAQPHDMSGVVGRAIGLWRRVLGADDPSVHEWEKVALWASQCSGAAIAAAAEAVTAESAETEPESEEAVADAAGWAALADAWAVDPAESKAERAAAWDVIARATLDAINTECDAQEVE